MPAQTINNIANVLNSNPVADAAPINPAVEQLLTSAYQQLSSIGRYPNKWDLNHAVGIVCEIAQKLKIYLPKTYPTNNGKIFCKSKITMAQQELEQPSTMLSECGHQGEARELNVAVAKLYSVLAF